MCVPFIFGMLLVSVYTYPCLCVCFSRCRLVLLELWGKNESLNSLKNSTAARVYYIWYDMVIIYFDICFRQVYVNGGLASSRCCLGVRMWLLNIFYVDSMTHALVWASSSEITDFIREHQCDNGSSLTLSSCIARWKVTYGEFWTTINGIRF